MKNNLCIFNLDSFSNFDLVNEKDLKIEEMQCKSYTNMRNMARKNGQRKRYNSNNKDFL